jgi:type IV pilus assembly protein PilB
MRRRATDRLIGVILRDNGIISNAQLDQALEIYNECKNGVLIGEILIELGFASEEDIIKAFLEQYAVPYINIENFDINPKAVNIIPPHIAEKYTLIPIDKIGNCLIVAMANPLDAKAIQELGVFCPNHNVQVYLASPSKVRKAVIEEYYKNKTIDRVDLFHKFPHDDS